MGSISIDYGAFSDRRGMSVKGKKRASRVSPLPGSPPSRSQRRPPRVNALGIPPVGNADHLCIAPECRLSASRTTIAEEPIDICPSTWHKHPSERSEREG
jgi:hypothetical protein